MTYFKVLFVLLAMLSAGCSRQRCDYEEPDIACINFIDREGISTTVHSSERLKQYEQTDFLSPQPYQKVMKVMERDCCGDIHSTITSYHTNGQPKQNLEVVNSGAKGRYREWHENGHLKVDCEIISGMADLSDEAERSWVFDGDSRAYDDCGHLLAVIHYNKGALEGESAYYYPSGKLRQRTPFWHGEINGIEEVFRENGDLLQSTAYKAGLREGPCHYFWPDGSLAADEFFHIDRLSSGRYIDRNGQFIAEVDHGSGFRAYINNDRVYEIVEISEGLPSGTVKVFDEEDQLTSTYQIKDGKRQGEEIYYYTSSPLFRPKDQQAKLLPKLSIQWKDDKVHGTVKTWYPNGIVESQREMTNNIRSGLATAWYRDGSAMLMEEYEDDKLVKGEYYKRGEKTPESKVTDGYGVAVLYDAEGNLIQKVHYFHGRPLD